MKCATSTVLAMYCLGGATSTAVRADAPVFFEAVGVHDCLSKTSGSRQCNLTGEHYRSCAEAENQMRRVDCCGLRPAGGHSVGFKLQSCAASNSAKKLGASR